MAYHDPLAQYMATDPYGYPIQPGAYPYDPFGYRQRDAVLDAYRRQAQGDPRAVAEIERARQERAKVATLGLGAAEAMKGVAQAIRTPTQRAWKGRLAELRDRAPIRGEMAPVGGDIRELASRIGGQLAGMGGTSAAQATQAMRNVGEMQAQRFSQQAGAREAERAAREAAAGEEERFLAGKEAEFEQQRREGLLSVLQTGLKTGIARKLQTEPLSPEAKSATLLAKGEKFEDMQLAAQKRSAERKLSPEMVAKLTTEQIAQVARPYAGYGHEARAARARQRALGVYPLPETPSQEDFLVEQMALGPVRPASEFGKGRSWGG